jgi:hypothetical protein
MPVFGLFHLLQALKHSRPRCVRTFAVKLAPIPNSRCVQFLGRIVQFTGHTKTSARDRLRRTLGLANGGRVLRYGRERPKPAVVMYSRQPRQYARILPSMWLTSSGMWSLR